MALVASPKWLDTGSNAWQMAAATFVGLQSIPGLVDSLRRHRQEEMGDQLGLHVDVRLCSVMVVWVLFDYNMAFGPQWFPFLGTPSRRRPPSS